MNQNTQETLSINLPDSGCDIKIDLGTRVYTVLSDECGVLLQGKKGRWAEIFRAGKLLYSITVGAEKDRVLRDANGEMLVRWTTGGEPVNQPGEGDDLDTLLPGLDFNSPLPSAECLTLMLCSEKV